MTLTRSALPHYLYRGQRVGHRQVGVVVGMDAHGHAHRFHGGSHRLYQLRWHGAAVRIAEDDPVHSGRGSGLQALQRVITVREETVEEVLRIEEYGPALVLHQAHRIGDHRQVLLGRRLQDIAHVDIVRLADERDDRRPGVQQCAQVGIVLSLGAGAPGAAEGGDLRQPPSMMWTPSSSSLLVIFSLSSTEREMPSIWTPSLRVVSYSWICMG